MTDTALVPAISVYQAAKRIRDVAHRTPLRRSTGLSAIARGDVLLKLETAQVTGSFKLRGAYNALAELPDDVRARGVVASSAGNHGLGVAYAARALGIAARIFVPATAPQVKKDGIAALGAEIDDGCPDYDAAMVAAKRHAAAHGSTYINPCLGDSLLAGQGTVALEILEELPEIRTLVVCVGGGGLLGGCASVFRAVAPEVHIAGSQSVNTAAMSRSLEAGHVVEIPSVPTLADGLAGQIDVTALALGRAGLDSIVTVSEEEIARAILWLLEEERETVEGAGAVGVAAILAGRLDGMRTPAAVIVSGRNIDQRRLEELIRSTRGKTDLGRR